MAKTIEVTSTQVNAARLLVKQAAARGESVPPAVAALANATPVTADRNGAESAPQQPVQGTNGHVNGRVSAPSSQPAPRPRYPA